MQKNSILIVEDDHDILKEVRKVLEDEGYQVDTADNGQKGLDLWEKNIYDLILVDLRIPGVDGMDLIKKIKKEQPYTQIVILSGQGKDDDLIDALNVHVYKYLPKPVNFPELLDTLKEALEKRDPVLLSLEKMALKRPDEPVLLVGKKSYTPKQLFDEVRRNTEFGKQYREEFLKSLLDYEHTDETVDNILGMKGVAE